MLIMNTVLAATVVVVVGLLLIGGVVARAVRSRRRVIDLRDRLEPYGHQTTVRPESLTKH